MSETERELTETEAEATGETVGEAKWAALRELERRFPGSTSRRSASPFSPRASAGSSASGTRPRA
jgi:hypothetical protein